MSEASETRQNMMCPNGCGVPLEKEDHVDGGTNSLYWCEDCDFQAIWKNVQHWTKGDTNVWWEVLFPGIGRE